MPSHRTAKTIDDLLIQARAMLPHRPSPAEAFHAQQNGSLLVDIRGDQQRRAGGLIPAAIVLPRNSLEWRCDPSSQWRHPAISSREVHLILVCNEGYQSSLAAATLQQQLGLTNATDLDGGFTAWAASGLPVTRRTPTPPAQPEGANMDDIAELHARALESTGAIVAGIPPDRWHDSTPCAGWDVRALVNHLISGNLWAAELAAGATIDDVGSRLDRDLLGSDPARSYAESAKPAAAAFRRPGALDAPCAVSYGPVPGSAYAGHRFIDVFTHGWDLAAATGQDTTLNADLLEACQKILEPQLEAFRQAGAIGGEVDAPPGASAQTRFLARLGRRG
jgi:uncharacterized protein (TIGR03086 family)